MVEREARYCVYVYVYLSVCIFSGRQIEFRMQRQVATPDFCFWPGGGVGSSCHSLAEMHRHGQQWDPTTSRFGPPGCYFGIRAFPPPLPPCRQMHLPLFNSPVSHASCMLTYLPLFFLSLSLYISLSIFSVFILFLVAPEKDAEVQVRELKRGIIFRH